MYMYVYYFVLYIIFYLYHLVLQQSYSPNTRVEKCFKIVSGIIQMLSIACILIIAITLHRLLSSNKV